MGRLGDSVGWPRPFTVLRPQSPTPTGRRSAVGCPSGQPPTPANSRAGARPPRIRSGQVVGYHRVVAVVLVGQRGRPPVPPAQQHHHRGDEQGADEEGVEQDAGGQPEPDLLHLGVAGGGQHPERTGQDEPGRGHGGAGGLDGPTHRRPDGRVVGFLADPGHDQDVVVLAQGHDEDEHEEGEDEVDPVLSADDLEDEDGQPQRGQVGEPHADHQVQRRHQAAQHDGQQQGPARASRWG